MLRPIRPARRFAGGGEMVDLARSSRAEITSSLRSGGDLCHDEYHSSINSHYYLRLNLKNYRNGVNNYREKGAHQENPSCDVSTGADASAYPSDIPAASKANKMARTIKGMRNSYV